jgi:pimeloyl-ACP methyl ester carboxylesterase
MPSKFPRSGVSVRSRSPTIGATTAWPRSHAEFPPRFALAGLSTGGYIAFEILRQAPERVAKLALLDTGARSEAPEQTERRKVVIALAKSGRYAEVAPARSWGN